MDVYGYCSDWSEYSVTISEPPLLNFYPKIINLGTLKQGESDIGIFEIWNDGDNTLKYEIIENIDWIDICSYDGETQGKHDTIAVKIINTDNLAKGKHTTDIQVDTNDGGTGVVKIKLNIGDLIDDDSEPENNNQDVDGEDDKEELTIADIIQQFKNKEISFRELILGMISFYFS